MDQMLFIFLVVTIHADPLQKPSFKVITSEEKNENNITKLYLESFNNSLTQIKTLQCENNCNYKGKSNQRCSCSENCIYFGDCCIDAPVNATTAQKWSCFGTLNTGEYYYMISTCKEFWENREIEIMCRNNSAENSLRTLPVSNKHTGETYRNIYCAICNNDFNVIPWIITSNSNISSGLRNGTVMKIIPDYEYAPSLKSCSSNVGLISTCRDGAIDPKCYTFYAPVITSDMKMYKNRYCARCNGDFTTLECLVELNTNSVRVFFETDYSYSLLLDIDFLNGGNIVGKMEKCPSLHIYDPWKERCVNVICPSNSLECSSKNSCKKYSKEEYNKLKNDSIYLTEAEIILDESNYKMLKNGDVLLCNDYFHEKFVSKFGKYHSYLTVVCTTVSLICLFLKILNYACSKRPRKLPKVIICYLSISLFSAQLLFLVTIDKIYYYTLCMVSAIATHYAFLASFFWNNVLSYDLWCTFSTLSAVKPIYSKTRIIKYSIYGWLTPALIVSTAIIFEYALPYTVLKPNYAHSVCWFSNKIALLVFFALPVALLLIINTVFFITTAVRISILSKTTKIAHENGTAKDKVRFQLYIKLALIMGMTWIFGFIAAYSGNDVIWYLFIISNSLQGVYIFVAFTHFKLPNRIYFKRSSCSSSTSYSTQISSSSTRI